MIVTPTQRFLSRELDNIHSNLTWVDPDQHPELVDEFSRRYQIISDLLDHTDTPEVTLTDIEDLLADAKQVLTDLSRPGRPDVSDRVRENLLIDIDYLTGLHQRLLQSLEQATVVYALEGVARL
jgi:hypothetical protein